MKRQNLLQILVAFAVCLGLCDLAFAQTAPNRKIKVALIYTGTSPQLKADTEGQVREQLGPDVEILVYAVPEVLQDITDAGHVTTTASAKWISTYIKAVDDGADAVLSVCSTVADIAYSMQEAADYMGVPILIINEEMCREAIKQGKRIAIVATLQTSIEPTKKIIARVSREMGRHDVEVTAVHIDGGYGLEQEKLKALMADKVSKIADQVDVIIFSQGSMAYCQEHVATSTGKTVLSNPYFGAKALKNALIAKGLME
jgi:hypothetical protein